MWGGALLCGKRFLALQRGKEASGSTVGRLESLLSVWCRRAIGVGGGSLTSPWRSLLDRTGFKQSGEQITNVWFA